MMNFDELVIDEHYTNPIEQLKNNGTINYKGLSDNEYVVTSVLYPIIDVEKTLEHSNGEDETLFYYTAVKEVVMFKNDNKVEDLTEYDLQCFSKGLYNSLLNDNNERMVETIYTDYGNLEQEFCYFYYVNSYNTDMVQAMTKYILKRQEQAKDELEKQVYGGYEPMAWELQ